MLTRYKINHSKADVNRLYIETKEGKRSLLQIEATHRAEIISIVEYSYESAAALGVSKQYRGI